MIKRSGIPWRRHIGPVWCRQSPGAMKIGLHGQQVYRNWNVAKPNLVCDTSVVVSEKSANAWSGANLPKIHFYLLRSLFTKEIACRITKNLSIIQEDYNYVIFNRKTIGGIWIPLIADDKRIRTSEVVFHAFWEEREKNLGPPELEWKKIIKPTHVNGHKRFKKVWVTFVKTLTYLLKNSTLRSCIKAPRILTIWCIERHSKTKEISKSVDGNVASCEGADPKKVVMLAG